MNDVGIFPDLVCRQFPNIRRREAFEGAPLRRVYGERSRSAAHGPCHQIWFITLAAGRLLRCAECQGIHAANICCIDHWKGMIEEHQHRKRKARRVTVQVA